MQRLLIVLFLLTGANAFAIEEGRFDLGVMGGHVGLLEDVGDIAGDSLGYGATLGVYAVDGLRIGVGYLMSDHDELKHSELFAGADIYLAGAEAIHPYISAGASLLTNDFEATDVSESAFGLYAGGGVDFEVSSGLMLGLQGRYQFAFDAETEYAGESYPVVQDSVTVMARLLFLFGKSSW